MGCLDFVVLWFARLIAFYRKSPVLVYITRLVVIAILVNFIFKLFQREQVTGENMVAPNVPDTNERPGFTVLLLCGIGCTGMALMVFLGWIIQKITGIHTTESLEVDTVPASSPIAQD